MVHQYTIIQNANEAAFVQQVNAALQQGWQPVGGVAIVPLTINGQPGFGFAQAMGR